MPVGQIPPTPQQMGYMGYPQSSSPADPQFKSQYNAQSGAPLRNEVSNIIPNTTYDKNKGSIGALIDPRDNLSVAGSEKQKISYKQYGLKDFREK